MFAIVKITANGPSGYVGGKTYKTRPAAKGAASKLRKGAHTRGAFAVVPVNA